MSPVNDLAKIRLDEDEYGFGMDTTGSAESGVLVELPEFFTHFGFWSFSFENSFMNKKDLAELHAIWKKQIGKRVYWTALSEKGNIIKKDNEKFAFIKLTSLIAIDEAKSSAKNLHSDGAGSFKI